MLPKLSTWRPVPPDPSTPSRASWGRHSTAVKGTGFGAAQLRDPTPAALLPGCRTSALSSVNGDQHSLPVLRFKRAGQRGMQSIGSHLETRQGKPPGERPIKARPKEHKVSRMSPTGVPRGRITEVSGHSTVCEGAEARDRGQVRRSLLESELYWRAAGSPRRALGREVPGLYLTWGTDQRRKTGGRDTARKPLQNTGENRLF